MDSEGRAPGQAEPAEGDLRGHPFASRPHRTVFALSLPVVGSLIAEPVTGVVDTAFIARLGAAPEAALGAASALISAVLWAFNFLGIGTQTEVATALGRRRPSDARTMASLALVVGAGLGLLLLSVGWPLADAAVRAMGADAAVASEAALYLRIRLLGAPAVLATVAAMGALRGLEAMRATLWIAVATNAVNLVLDPILIFGAGPVPRFGLGGAAAASAAAQWLGLGIASATLRQRLGLARVLRLRDATRLFVIGRDLFVRTAALVFFGAVLTTRAANQIGVEAAAAHIAIRQLWGLSAFALDAFAHTAQTLVGSFLAAGQRALARRAAAITNVWSFATGIAIGALMLGCSDWVGRLLVPPEARSVFALPWCIAALAQPINAIAFNTDGIHWGTGDYRYLRNAMLLSSGLGALLLLIMQSGEASSLSGIWTITALWIAVRATLGFGRFWPGWGHPALNPRSASD